MEEVRMSKQHLEGYLSRSIKEWQKLDDSMWHMKLQVMPLSHTTTPADFIVLNKNTSILIECKETKALTGLANFPFDRLTQERDLVFFRSRSPKFRAYLMMTFWKGTLKKSNTYMIPINKWIEAKKTTTKKSFNERDIDVLFVQYRLTVLKGSIFDLKSYIF